MFILTDGKNYVMENPMVFDSYMTTEYIDQAKEFTYKNARSLLHSKKKSLSWLKKFYMLNKETNKKEVDVPLYSNKSIFCDDKDINFDDSVVDEICKEVNIFMTLKTWDIMQLNSYIAILNDGLSYYDSAISDVKHAILDKRPPAHVRTKIFGILSELEEKRRDIKQVRNYIDVLIKAYNNRWTLETIKNGLKNAKFEKYNGRTKYYEYVENLLQ